MKHLFTLFALLSLLAVPCHAEKISLGGGKALHLVVPETWISTEGADLPPDIPTTGQSVRYATKSGSNDAVLITILPVPDERFSDRENLKALAEQSAEQFVAGSVEGKTELKELRFGGVSGYSATFTDANLVGKPTVKDDYKMITCCFAYLGDQVMVTATIFSDDRGGKAYTEAMRILKSISLTLPKDTI